MWITILDYMYCLFYLPDLDMNNNVGLDVAARVYVSTI